MIRGLSGSGKSSLALGLIDDPQSLARLVGDDRILLTSTADGLVARPPVAIAGLLELRGVGLLRPPCQPEARIALVVDLLPLEECIRFPDENGRNARVMDRSVPRLTLPIGAGDGVLRVRLALREWVNRERSEIPGQRTNT